MANLRPAWAIELVQVQLGWYSKAMSQKATSMGGQSVEGSGTQRYMLAEPAPVSAVIPQENTCLTQCSVFENMSMWKF